MSPLRNSTENVENLKAMAEQNKVLSITQTLKVLLRSYLTKFQLKVRNTKVFYMFYFIETYLLKI